MWLISVKKESEMKSAYLFFYDPLNIEQRSHVVLIKSIKNNKPTNLPLKVIKFI